MTATNSPLASVAESACRATSSLGSSRRYEPQAERRARIVVRYAALLVWVLLLTVMSRSAHAQTPTFEISGAYQHLRTADDHRFPAGWDVMVGRNFGSVFAIVADVGGVYRSETAFGVTAKAAVYNVGAGPRATLRRSSFLLFGQVVGGVVIGRTTVSAEEASFSGSRSRSMLQPGAGATKLLGAGWGVTGEFGYRYVFLSEDADSKSSDRELRILVGAHFLF